MASFTSSHPVVSADARHGVDLTVVLDDCCASTAACRFQLVHSGDSMTAAFHSLSKQGIEFLVSPSENGRLPRTQAIVCVSFPFRASFCAFVGCVSEVNQVRSDKCIVLTTIPKELTTTNLRQSFRVPVIGQSGLETLIRTAHDRTFRVHALDIAETGLEVEFDGGIDSALSVGSSVIVELQFRGEIIQRTAEVRRIYADRCGLYFDNSSDETGHRLEARMHGLVLAIQQMWLKSRLN